MKHHRISPPAIGGSSLPVSFAQIALLAGPVLAVAHQYGDHIGAQSQIPDIELEKKTHGLSCAGR
jgi:hypothetical protein